MYLSLRWIGFITSLASGMSKVVGKGKTVPVHAMKGKTVPVHAMKA
jgi:hypothetical protein